MLSTQRPADPLRKDSAMDVVVVLDNAAKHTSQTMDSTRRQKTTFAGGRDGLRIPPPASSSTSSRMTMKLLERKCQKHIEAVNSRDFYEDGAIWFDKTEDWEAEIPFLSDKTMNLPQHVAAWQKLARRYPEYGIRCIEMTTAMGEGGRSAETFAVVEITGMPTGTAWRSTCVASFESVEGKWLATKFKTIPG
ncbi:Hypothetical predicted protein [Lecanosticta acicola]|uniref:SnoaL-like domain-containing protein n=1 Tax=Lecanosticta acicola TaxID=111012 RepID=A0AAI9EAK8_9PEZI|nr:Hypothetical predicted protein [Lecanosticta acicola]